MHPLAVVCQPGTHCCTCRNREGGRAWRQSLGAAVTLPADAPDFACPYGKPWGVPPLPRASDAEIESLIARDAAEGGCGCAGGYTDVTRPE
jgi:hypothetical protein